MSPTQIAVTQADFTRTSVTDPSVTGQSNLIPTKFLLSVPKEVNTSKSEIKINDYSRKQDRYAHRKLSVENRKQIAKERLMKGQFQ